MHVLLDRRRRGGEKGNLMTRRERARECERITLGPAAIAAIAAVAGAWVQTRFGRRIQLKFDDVDAEAGTAQAIDELLKRP